MDAPSITSTFDISSHTLLILMPMTAELRLPTSIRQVIDIAAAGIFEQAPLRVSCCAFKQHPVLQQNLHRLVNPVPCIDLVYYRYYTIFAIEMI